MKLGKNQSAIFILFGLATTFFYYANKTINTSQGTFSDGILVGFLLAFTLTCSIGSLFIFIRMIYLNFKARITKDERKQIA